MKVLTAIILAMLILLSLISCGPPPDYESLIYRTLNQSGADWQQTFEGVAVDGLNSVFMVTGNVYQDIKSNPASAGTIAQLCLDITIAATQNVSVLTRAGLIAPDGTWLADADITLDGKIEVDNYILQGKRMLYPDYQSLFQ